VRPAFEYLVDVIAEISGSRDGAFEKAVAIWAAVHGLSALKKSKRAARLEQTVIGMIERGLGGRAKNAPNAATRPPRAKPIQ
jgi:hypothetical protein